MRNPQALPTFSSKTAGRYRRQRGSVMLIAMMTLVGLVSLGGLTALSMQSGLQGAGHNRFDSVALYAAESGGSAAMNFLRNNIDASANWGAYVNANNQDPITPVGIVGQGIRPGETGNPFSDDIRAWYEVVILNNRSDPGFEAGNDEDARVIIRATGYGPDGARKMIEMEVRANGVTALGRPCPVYGQKGIAEDGAGRNDCLSTVQATDVATFKPGG